jgi:hypothetical protein
MEYTTTKETGPGDAAFASASVASSGSGFQSATSLEAVRAYLKEKDQSGRDSILDSALRDARVTMKGREAMWLATLGYLVLLEQVGKNVARPGTKFKDRSNSTTRFRAGALEWSDDDTDTRLSDTLYALRCTLAHEYSLRGTEKPYVFMYTRSGPIVRYAEEDWDGIVDGAKRFEMQTVVNVVAVGEYVEAVVASLRAAGQRGEVEMERHATVEDLLLFGSFVVVDGPA